MIAVVCYINLCTESILHSIGNHMYCGETIELVLYSSNFQVNKFGTLSVLGREGVPNYQGPKFLT